MKLSGESLTTFGTMENGEHIIPNDEKPIELGSMRYFVLMTLATTFIPAVIVSVPVIILCCFSPAIVICIPALLGIGYFAWWMVKKGIPRFHAAVFEGRMPKNGIVVYLPLFLPLLYTLAVTAYGFSDRWDDVDDRLMFFLWALPQYILPNMGLAILIVFGGGNFETISTVPLSAGFLTAVGGTCYINYLSPRGIRHFPVIAGLCILCFAFGIVIFGTYSKMREYVLPRDDSAKIVGDETDLRPYVPFSNDNKLVTIEGEIDLRIESDHPRLHGALALYPVYAAAAQGTYGNLTAKEAEQIVRAGTSPAAFSSLIYDNADMVFMLRPSEAQIKKAEAAGKTLTVTSIGREAFVFFVSMDNPVDELSSGQIRDIYSKRITRWSELGGKNEKILPFQRPGGSGSQTAMERFMGERPLAQPVKEEYKEMMGGIVNRVADYRNYGNSIGYSFRYYIEGMFKHEGIKLLAVDGIEPSPENIRNGTYPLVGEMVIVTAGSENPNVPKLIEWFLSPQGQDLIEKVGYVPLRTEEAAEK